MFSLFYKIIRLIFIFASILTLLLFFFASSYGSSIFLKIIAKLIPGQLEIHHVDGSFAANLFINDIHYHNKAIDISIHSLHFSWNPNELLNKRIAIKKLQIKGININTEEAQAIPEAKSFSLKDYEWLHFISLDQFMIEDLTWHSPNKTQRIDTLIVTKNRSDEYIIKLNSTFGKIKGLFFVSNFPALLDMHAPFSWKVRLTYEDLNLSPSLHPLMISGDLKSDGSWNQSEQKISVNVNKLKGELGKLPLTGSLSLNYFNGNGQIQNAMLSLGNSFVSLSGTLNQSWNIAWQLSSPQINSFLPESIGHIAAKGTITGKKNAPSMQGEINLDSFATYDYQLKSGRLTFSAQIPENSAKIHFDAMNLGIKHILIPKFKLDADSQFVDEKLKSLITLGFDQENQIRGTLSITKIKSLSELFSILNLLSSRGLSAGPTHTYPQGSLPIEGNFQIDCQKIENLLTFSHGKTWNLKFKPKNFRGRLLGDITLSGFATQPIIAMHMNLQDGSLSVPRFGTQITELQLNANAKSGQPLLLSGQFKAGDGIAYLNGTADLNKNHSISMSLTGKNLQVMHLKSYKVTASPNIHLSYSDNETSIIGTLLLPTFEMTTDNFENVVTLPKEVVFVDQKNQESSIPSNLSMKLQIALGEHAHLSYYNLDADLDGNIIISEYHGNPFTATGELHIKNGTYKAYGQVLKIKKGRLTYAGNDLMNPRLDINATKTVKSIAVQNADSQFFKSSDLQSVYTGVNKIVVGVLVHGDATNPSLFLFSEPKGLNQDDILSYLVFGYPRSQIKSTSGLALLNALASSKKDSTIGDITNTIKTKLGLSQLEFQSLEYFDPKKNETGRTTFFTVSKKLRKNLSLQYSIGLFNPVSILSLRYKLNKHLTLKTETSTLENGADLLYQIERDG